MYHRDSISVITQIKDLHSAFLLGLALLIPSALLTFIDRPSIAQDSRIDNNTICGTIIRGYSNTVNCSVFINTWPKNELSQRSELCEQENFGLLPPILFMTKKRYSLGEIIAFRFSGACPQRTRIGLIDANRVTKTLDRGLGAVLIHEYQGYVDLRNNRPTAPGDYSLVAFFVDSAGRAFPAGRSLPFSVYERF
jgi:hypothetical protein